MSREIPNTATITSATTTLMILPANPPKKVPQVDLPAGSSPLPVRSSPAKTPSSGPTIIPTRPKKRPTIAPKMPPNAPHRVAPKYFAPAAPLRKSTASPTRTKTAKIAITVQLTPRSPKPIRCTIAPARIRTCPGTRGRMVPNTPPSMSRTITIQRKTSIAQNGRHDSLSLQRDVCGFIIPRDPLK